MKLRAAVVIASLLIALNVACAGAAGEATIIPDLAAEHWMPAPATLPKGTKILLLDGDPSKAGPFALRVEFPPNTTIAAHRHATAESLTVLQGSFYHEVGDTVDKSHGTLVKTGGFVYLPGMTPHSLWTTSDGDTIVQVDGTGPFGLLYVNPADDPSKSS